MELANCRLHIGNDSDVPLRSITPAEAMLLVSLHKDRAKKHPISDLKIIGTAQSIKTPVEVQESDSTAEEDTKVYHADGTTSTIAKGQPLLAGTVLKPAEYRPRTAHEEISRLRTKYHKTSIDYLFPKGSTIPETFAAAEESWKEVPKVADEGVTGSWTDEPGPLQGSALNPLPLRVDEPNTLINKLGAKPIITKNDRPIAPEVPPGPLVQGSPIPSTKP